MFHRTWAAVLTATAVLLGSSPAAADQDEYLVFVGGVDTRTAVWEAGPVPGMPVFLREFENDHDAHQYWYWNPEAGTFRNQASGQCLTADGTAVRQTPCRAGAEDQVWDWRPVDDPDMFPALLSSVADSGSCVTHAGLDDPLVLEPCDVGRADQQWNVYVEAMRSLD
ncbi:RICIN domain-containing protein [Saccharothrix sp. Mg75]|uniref:RICIN domain-containing protein n=1 Tax=Saccharothrix sp. Mg75 TaxID=3445357 RepID=UPI003EF004B6